MMEQESEVTILALGMVMDDELLGASGFDISKTITTQKALTIDNKFEDFVESFGKIILLRNSKTTLEEKQKLFKIFYTHTKKNYVLGHNYTNKVTENDAPISESDLERIDRLAKEALAVWLSRIESEIK